MSAKDCYNTKTYKQVSVRIRRDDPILTAIEGWLEQQTVNTVEQGAESKNKLLVKLLKTGLTGKADDADPMKAVESPPPSQATQKTTKDKHKNPRFPLRIPLELKTALTKRADRRGITLNALLEHILWDYVERRGDAIDVGR